MESGELMPERPATIDVNAIRDPSIKLNGLTGIDTGYTFYYDETNNIRRLSVAAEGFNVGVPRVFVLGGIVHSGLPRDLDFAGLRSALRLQPNVLEMKFEQIAHGDFLTVLGSRKLTTFLEWVEAHDLDLHYLALDPLYWATVDIIDSIIDQDAVQLAMVAPILKNDLYRLLRSDIQATADFFHRSGFPNLSPAQRPLFMQELLDLMQFRSGSLPPFNQNMLKGVLQMGSRAPDLPYLSGNETHVLIDEFSTFFAHRICLFKNSEHIFDDEHVVRAAFGKRRFVDGGRELNSFRFARSQDEEGIQLSDAMVGLLGSLFSWLNSNSLDVIGEALRDLNPSQDENRRRINRLMDRSVAVCAAFSQYVMCLDDQQAGALFLES